MKIASLLLLVFALSACDRFADEDRRLVLEIVDASGNPASGVRVHAAPRLSPQTHVPQQFRYLATSERVGWEVVFSIVRESTGARTRPISGGLASPGAPVVLEIDSDDIGAGLFRLRVDGGQEIEEVLFALSVGRSAAELAPAQSVTGSGGIADIDLDAYGIGRRLDLTLTSNGTDGDPELRSVTLVDTLDLVLYAPTEDRAWSAVVPLRPGLTRTTLTVPIR